MWTQVLFRLDETEEQYIFLCPLGPSSCFSIFWQWWCTCTLSWLKLSVRPWTHRCKCMRQRICVLQLLVSWVGGSLHSIMQLSIVYGLPFCGPNVIDHFMCDTHLLLKPIFTNTCIIGFLVLASGGLICTVVILLLIITYGIILHSLKNLSQEGRQKVLHICGSHISVVICFFVLVFLCMEDVLRASPLKNNWVYRIHSVNLQSKNPLIPNPLI